MSSAEIKFELFNKLDQLDSKRLKQAYHLLLEFLGSSSLHTDKDQLSPAQKKKIDLAIQQSEQNLSQPVKGVTDQLRKKYNL